MRKIYSLSLLLTTLLCTGLSARAIELKFEWDDPGSVRIQTGSLVGPFLEIPADQTSYTYTSDESYVSAYVYAEDGYFLNSLTLQDGKVLSSKNYKGSIGQSFYEDNVIKINAQKINRSENFTFDVVNGSNCFTATFTNSSYTLNLSNGENTIPYDPEIDKNLQISYINGTVPGNPSPALYKVTYDDTDVAKNQYYNQWTIPEIEPGKTVKVWTYEEGKEPVVNDYTLNLEFTDGTAGSLNNIFNFTTYQFLKDAAGNYIASGSFTVTEGTVIGLNFNEDYDITDIKLNGTSLASSATVNGNQWKFTVTESGTLSIEGSPKDYGQVTFTAYVMNPEGVVLTKGSYGGSDYADLTSGDAVSGDIQLSGTYILKAAESKVFTFDVDGKTPRVFISPEDGWYIQTVQTNDGSKFEEINSADESSTTFYVIAKKLDSAYTATFNVIGESASLTLKGDQSLSGNWDNPDSRFSLSDGIQDISFFPYYDLPLSISSTQGIDNLEVYVDGKVTQLDTDSQTKYIIDPYYPADDDAAQLHSTVTVYSGTTKGKVGNVSLTSTDISTRMQYSTARRTATASEQLLYGTPVYIYPGTSECIIKVNGTVVHGIDTDGTVVNGLDNEGEYVFEVNAVNTKITVAPQATFDIPKISPADGSTVNNIAKVTVYLPETVGSEHQPSITEEKAMNVTLTPENGEPIHATGSEEAVYDNMSGYLTFPITFDAVTEAGVYTLDIPAGTFFESEYDTDLWETVAVENGAVSKALTATITVDPNVKRAIDTYTLSPGSGSALNSISTVYLTLTEYSALDMFQIDETKEVTFSNGTTTYYANFGYDWNNVTNRGFVIIPRDDDYNDVSITDDGEWTLSIPAGALSYQGESNSAIEATFNISAEYPAYPITPVPGSVTGNLGKIVIEFPGAYEAEYTEGTYISLKGDDNDFDTSTGYVSGLNPFTIEFASLPQVAGEYTLTIPAGAFTIDGEPSAEVVAHYTYKPIYEFTPAGGSTVENLDELTITFPDATEVEFVGSRWSFSLTASGSYAAPGYECEQINSNAFRLTLPDGAGSIPNTSMATFRIDEGAFIIDGVPSPVISTTYRIERQIEASWTASPEKTIVYNESGIYWAFVFDESGSVSYPDKSKISVTLDGTEITSYGITPENNNLMMQITDPDLIKEGELTVTIEAGAFNISGTPNDEIIYTWNVVAPKEYTYTLSPDNSSKVNDLSEITLSFPEAETAEIFIPRGVSLKTNDYSYYGTATITEVAGSEHPTFSLSFDPAPENLGQYTLEVFHGTFTLDGVQESPEIELVYSFDKDSGVWNIGIDGKSTVTIVTIDGRVIAKDAPASAVDNLVKGNVYIINGVKVLIK